MFVFAIQYIRHEQQQQVSLMEAISNYLVHTRAKKPDKQLSLPLIPQQTRVKSTKTSFKVRKQRSIIKFVSETTLTPEQQQLHQQVKITLGKMPNLQQHGKSSQNEYNKLKVTRMSEKKNKSKHNNSALSRVTNEEQKTVRQNELNQNTSTTLKLNNIKKNQNKYEYMNIQNILHNRDSFISAYFAQINKKPIIEKTKKNFNRNKKYKSKEKIKKQIEEYIGQKSIKQKQQQQEQL